MQDYGLPSWFLKVYRILVIAVAGLIVLGGSVRVMNAGLACPDWPLCFGNFVPDFHPQVYFEFIHRVVAGSVAIVTVALQGILFLRPKVPGRVKWLAGLSLLMLAGQIVLGGLTVLLQLKAGVVASHLAMGTAFFALLLWISLDLQRASREPQKVELAGVIRGWTGFFLLSVYGQMLLGGVVASSSAALACTEFPKCQGVWFPGWEGPVGINMIHRMGAYTIALLALVNLILLSKSTPFLRKQSRMIIGAVLIQIGLGIANAIFYTPPIVQILHLAVALKILYLAVRQFHFAAGADIKGGVIVQNQAELQGALS